MNCVEICAQLLIFMKEKYWFHQGDLTVEKPFLVGILDLVIGIIGQYDVNTYCPMEMYELIINTVFLIEVFFSYKKDHRDFVKFDKK